MRLGIPGHGFFGWTGGVDFLRLVIDSLGKSDAGALELYLLVPGAGPVAVLKRCYRALRSAALGRPAPASLVPDTTLRELCSEFHSRLTLRSCDDGHYALRRAARRLEIDCLLPLLRPLGMRSPPWVGYVYDFQHRHLPHFFSPRELRARDEHFARMAAEATIILVNSQSVADDLRAFYPASAASVVRMPFAPSPMPEWLEDLPGMRDKYGVPGRYFLVSNHFWQHKDHATAFKAFARLGDAAGVQLVCTGTTDDFRDPGYFDRLMGLVRELGIEGRVRVLGVIPKRHQIELVKGAIAVVQPTLFEGGPGGGAVYDAIAVGTPALVSDIPVNREATGGDLAYFPPQDADALCRCLGEAIVREPHRARPEAATLLRNGLERRRACGNAIVGAAARAIAAQAS